MNAKEINKTLTSEQKSAILKLLNPIHKIGGNLIPKEYVKQVNVSLKIVTNKDYDIKNYNVVNSLVSLMRKGN